MSTGGSESISGSGSLMDYPPLNEQEIMNYFARKYNQKELIKMYRAARSRKFNPAISASESYIFRTIFRNLDAIKRFRFLGQVYCQLRLQRQSAFFNRLYSVFTQLFVGSDRQPKSQS